VALGVAVLSGATLVLRSPMMTGAKK